ncbi:unnamed protein product [Cylicocyclus nassatus]|uniref:Uncharacterized protein n=1 Tax=Cylicocyclus nassatus TaxID=53992 RepID=A0AA36GMT7_CYLNA|nr:unnamed protein product [Cylicocyclus nassatus]
MNCLKYMVADNVPIPSTSGKSYRVIQIAPNPKTQNVQPNPVKISYAANKNKFYQVPPQNVYSHSPAPLLTRIEPPNPFLPVPPCMSSQNSGSTSREPLRETSVDNCVPSSVRFPKRYKMQSSELSKIHLRNPWLKDSISAPRSASPPLANASDSEEDYEEEEDSPRSSPLFHHRHRYNFSGSETSFKDYDPLSCSDYDEDEEDSPRSSPLFHHRHRYNSDSETPYYSPYSEDSDDYTAPSALAHQNEKSKPTNPSEDFCALTSKESNLALCPSPLVQDLVPDSGEEASPTSSPPKFPLCDKLTGPVTPVKNESYPRFIGVKRVSLKGRHDVLVYSIPDTDNAYVFCHERTNVDYQIFKCLKCWNEKVKTTIKVIGEKFFGNPCDLGHVCSPVDELEDRVERLTYKWLTDLQEQSKSCRNSPKEEYANFLIWLRDDSDKGTNLYYRFCKPKKARIEDHIEKFVQQSLLMHSSYPGNGEQGNSDMDESFPGKVVGGKPFVFIRNNGPSFQSTMEVLEWIAGIGENEKFYTF